MLHTMAKELKDAGFPNIQDVQHRQGREFVTPDGRVSVYSLGQIAPTEDWFIPTLKELIEACEKKTAVTTSSLSIHNSDGLRLLRHTTSKPTAGPISRLPKKQSLACGWP